MTTGQLIKEARKKAGMTQLELAQKLNIPFQSISQWERDIRNPKYETLQRIAAALDTPVSFFFGWDGVNERLLNLGLSVDDIAYELDAPSDAIQGIIESNDNGTTEAMLKIIKVASILANHTESQKNDTITQIRAKLEALSSPVERTARVMSQMTPEGQKKVADYAADILPRYRAESTPQSSPTPINREDTTSNSGCVKNAAEGRINASRR